MFFETQATALAAEAPALVAQTVHAIRTVRETIRLGDIDALAFTVSSTLNKQVMVETIVAPPATGGAPGQLLLAIVNTDASGYSNLLCHVDLSRHWKFKKHTIDTLALHTSSMPQIASISNWREAIGDKIVPLTDVAVNATGADVVLSQIALDDQLVARWLLADVSFL